jgi:protein TonB
MFSGLAVPETIPVRRWTAVLSFTLQAAAIAAALVIPMLYPNSLTQLVTARHIFTPASYEPVTTNATHPVPHSGTLSPRSPIFVRQNHIFTFHPQDQDSTVALAPNVFEYSGPPGVPNSIIGTNVQPVIPAPPPVRHPRTSVMMEGNLIHRVEPVYPIIAKQAGIQGTVVVRALISRAGVIEQAQVVSGPALLAPTAVEAIRQWKYRPYVLNGDPIEVETQITVNFILRH